MSTLQPTIEQTGNGLRRTLALIVWNMQRALMITRREVVDMFRDWRILIPIVVLTVIFPYIANWGAGQMVDFVAEYQAAVIADRLIPFLMMVVGFFPSSFSLIIALESFAGEKERKSLEPLLSTPLTDLQLYIGKMLSSTLPPLVGSMIGIGVYMFGITRTLEWHAPPRLIAQILLLTVLQSLVMVAGAVVVSSQSTSVRAANLLASFIIVPMSLLIQLEAFIMFVALYDLIWWILLGLVVTLFILIRMGVHTFNREELLGRELDEVNLRAIITEWWNHMLARRPGAPKRSAWQWYREEALALVWRLRLELLVQIIVMGVGVYVGLELARQLPIPPSLFNTDQFGARFQQAFAATGLQGPNGILLILAQNIRTLAVASLLSVFSFGIMALLALMAPVALVSYLGVQLNAAGLDPVTIFAAVAPHTIFEIPAAMVAGATALKLGAVVIAPPPDKTLGKAWIEALAEASRLWFTVILPLLVIAAIVEVLVTPQVVGWLASR